MRYVTMQEARPGMRLARDIYDSFGRTLIGNNRELTSSYIEKLTEYGFDGVYITDEISEGIEIDCVISPQLRAQGQSCIRNNNIDGCKEVAKKIVEEILGKGNLSLDLADLRSYDDYTYAHSVNVAVIACVIGMGMGLDETELTYVVTAGLLHDLGKLSMPPEILNKPGKLTVEEYQVMKQHARISYELIQERWDISAHIKNAVLSHHENVDGSGYPNGIDGSEQSIHTKILHVADVYDALISKRPYKNPYSPYEAIEYMMGACGIMFEQTVVESLMQFVPLFPKGTEVTLSDGRVGIIYENSGKHNMRPIVKLFDSTLLDLSETSNLNLTILALEADGAMNLEESEAARKEMLRPLKKYHIMAVDDMKTNLQAIRGMLEPLYDVTLIKSGKQALMYLKKNPYPDLVLMDINMPEMNGIDTAHHVMELTEKTVPILFVTAVSDKNVISECKNMGAAGYIVRPYKPAYIKSEIKRILTGWNDVE